MIQVRATGRDDEGKSGLRPGVEGVVGLLGSAGKPDECGGCSGMNFSFEPGKDFVPDSIPSGDGQRVGGILSEPEFIGVQMLQDLVPPHGEKGAHEFDSRVVFSREGRSWLDSGETSKS